MEEWKEFLEGYEVSNAGVVRSRKCGRCKPMSIRIDNGGYESIFNKS